MTQQIVMAVALLGLGACATSGSEVANLDAEHGDYENAQICSYERETGSMQRTRVCRTQAQIDSDRTDAKKAIKEMDESSLPSVSD